MPQYSGVWNLAQQARALTSQQWVTDPLFKNTTLLLQADNAAGGAQNNTFLDSSSNAFAITRNGNTTQGTFSPFSQTGWSNFFDGTDDYLTITDNAVFQFGTGNFTIEFWVNFSTVNSADRRMWSYQAAGATVVNVTIDTSNKISATLRSSTGTGINTIASTTTMVVGTWYHVAFVRSGTTTYLFVNGTQEATASNQNQDLGSGLIGIGARSDATEDFAGYISNLRVTKGGALYTSAFTPSTTPLTTTVSAGTVSLLTCQSNRFVDNSSNAFAITVNGTPSVQAFSPFAPQYQYDPAVTGASGYFDGSGDYLSASSAAAFSFGTGNFTFECWAYRTGSAASQCLYLINVNDGFIVYTVSNKVVVRNFNGADLITSVDNLSTNAWMHIAVARSGTTLSLWLNGSRASGGTTTNSTNFAQGALVVGTNENNTLPYTGYLSGLRVVKGTAIYDPTQTTITIPTAPPTAITNTQLLLNFTNAGIYDGTLKNNLETVGNAQVSTTVVKYGSGSMYFDGTGDYLIFPQSQNCVFGTGDFTIEFWAYPTSFPNACAVIDTRSGAASTTGMQIAITATTGFPYIFIGNATLFTSSQALPVNTWTHVAAVRQSGVITIYINGVKPLTGSATSTQTLTDTDVTIGSSFDNRTTTTTAKYNGYIDDLRITKGIARYTRNFTPPQVALPRQ